MADRRPPRRPGGKPPQRPRRPGSRPQGSRPGPARGSGASPRARTDRPDAEAGPERLQKVLAHAGVGSRRACEELILQGRVTVDGKVVRELGTRIEPARSQVAVDGQKVHLERPVYFAVYKPKGYVSTNADPGGRPRVVDLLPEIPQRVYTVGRLDEMSVGLMLLTNDGELANRLAHPKFGVEKVYRALVAGLPTPEVLQQLTEGVWLAEGKVRARRVRIAGRKGEATVLEMVLAEGKNREVRRMLARLGHKVMSLVRVAIGPITLRGLSVGQWRHLAAPEVDLLRRVAAGESLPAPSPVRGDRRPRRRPVDEAREPAPSGPAAGPGPAPQRRPSRPSVSASRPTVTPRPSGPQRRPAGPARGPSGGPRRPAAGAGIGPARGPGTRPPRPQGPPSRRPAPPPAPEPPTRRIIGLEPEGPSGPPSGPGSRRPVPKRRAPGAASRRRPRPLVPRRRTRPSTEGGEEA